MTKRTLLPFLVVVACGGDPAKQEYRGPNRPPAFPESATFETTTQIERDARGRITGAVTTVTVHEGATDPDGDSLSYRWEGARFNGDTLIPVTLDADHLRARFRSGVIMDEAAGGVLRLIATDGKGNQAVKQICVAGGGFSC